MKQSVLDAAQKLVDEKGIEGLSLRGIARELGYSPAAIYEYFESLEEIVLTLYFQGSNGLTGALDTCCEALPSDIDSPTALLRLGEVFRKHALAKPELYRFTYNVMKQPVQHLDESQDPSVGLESVLEVVTRGIERGELLDVEPFTITLAAWTAAHGFVSLEVSDHFTWLESAGLTHLENDGKDAISQLYRQMLLGIIRGWTTDKGKALIPE